jgi:hypothetical protein
MSETKTKPEMQYLFAGMSYVLHRLTLCDLKTITGTIWQRSNWAGLRRDIWKGDPEEAIRYIDLTIDKLSQIKALGDKIYQNLTDEVIENKLVDDETGAPYDYDNRMESKSICRYFLDSTESELKTIRETITSNLAFTAKPKSDKIKMNLSVGEMAVFFRLFEEAKIVPLNSRGKMGRMIVENISPKGKEEIESSESISNKMGYDMNADNIPPVMSLLESMAKSAASLLKALRS